MCMYINERNQIIIIFLPSLVNVKWTQIVISFNIS